MRLILPSTIDIRLTSDCNKKCEFCFGTTISSERTVQNWEQILSKFKSAGVKNIVITGGEPATISKLAELVVIAHEKGFTVCLSTNGTVAFRDDIDIVLANIDWLSLPLEGETFFTHRLLRQSSLSEYHNIFALIRYAKEKFNTGIKIGTVVSKLNINSIEGIPLQIYQFADTWKLYQVYLAGKRDEIIGKYSISLSEYYAVYNKCKSLCAKYPHLKCVSYDAETMNGICLIFQYSLPYHDIQANKEHPTFPYLRQTGKQLPVQKGQS